MYTIDQLLMELARTHFAAQSVLSHAIDHLERERGDWNRDTIFAAVGTLTNAYCEVGLVWERI